MIQRQDEMFLLMNGLLLLFDNYQNLSIIYLSIIYLSSIYLSVMSVWSIKKSVLADFLSVYLNKVFQTDAYS